MRREEGGRGEEGGRRKKRKGGRREGGREEGGGRREGGGRDGEKGNVYLHILLFQLDSSFAAVHLEYSTHLERERERDCR